MELLHTLLANWSDIAQAVLAVLGGLKIIARYTPFEWDDKALAALESPVTALLKLFKK